MKVIKWKNLAVTCAVCLLPILLGLLLWEKLPDTMAIHFDINNNPDNFASKEFVVFGLPFLMVLLQAICCVINDIQANIHGVRKKFERVTKWIIPFMAIILQIITMGYSLGWNVDIRKCAAFIVGTIFLAIGNILPKFDYIKNYNMDTQKARKINRFIGYETVVMGILYLVSIFLPPVATLCCVFLMIPYAVIGAIYGVRVGKK